MNGTRPGYDPTTNLIITGTVDWCDTVRIADDKKLAAVPIGQPWTGMAYLNPINMFGKEATTDKDWAGWVYATDADTGVWKWRVKSNYPIVGAITPTAGGVVFFGDLGGNFYALDSSTGQKLWGQVLGTGGGIGGGIITYTRERRAKNCRGRRLHDGRVADEARDRQGHHPRPRRRLREAMT